MPAPESTPESTAEMFGAMDPLVFEQAIAELCVRDGCQDVEVSGGAGDLGADVTGLTPDGRRLVVQCKRYGPVNKVGSQDMQRFGGTCFAVHQAEVAVLVTTGEFTGPAAEYADECGILRYDSEALTAWADATGPAPGKPITRRPRPGRRRGDLSGGPPCPQRPARWAAATDFVASGV